MFVHLCLDGGSALGRSSHFLASTLFRIGVSGPVSVRGGVGGVEGEVEIGRSCGPVFQFKSFFHPEAFVSKMRLITLLLPRYKNTKTGTDFAVQFFNQRVFVPLFSRP